MPTKKTFQMVADIIREQTEPANKLADGVARAMLFIMADRFAREFARQNPRFDRDRFMAACGLNS